MSDYLSHLVSRQLQPESGVGPRIASMFAPAELMPEAEGGAVASEGEPAGAPMPGAIRQAPWLQVTRALSSPDALPAHAAPTLSAPVPPRAEPSRAGAPMRGASTVVVDPGGEGSPLVAVGAVTGRGDVAPRPQGSGEVARPEPLEREVALPVPNVVAAPQPSAVGHRSETFLPRNPARRVEPRGPQPAPEEGVGARARENVDVRDVAAEAREVAAGTHVASRTRAPLSARTMSGEQPTSGARRVSRALAEDGLVARPLTREGESALPGSLSRGRERVLEGGEGAPAPVVQVTIGRIEVRAAAPAASPKPPPSRGTPSLSLDEYLRRRNGGGR
ncbi:hypothetical protein JGU66_18555 [Myxococcaceae bacterium JPH2]|nr:hypothetical protein [Myxococcaceae bacterium JPH2]